MSKSGQAADAVAHRAEGVTLAIKFDEALAMSWLVIWLRVGLGPGPWPSQQRLCGIFRRLWRVVVTTYDTQHQAVSSQQGLGVYGLGIEMAPGT